jgi:hypothetical protein
MQAGDDVLTVEYKGTLTHASLTHDGRIRWKGVECRQQHSCTSELSSIQQQYSCSSNFISTAV